MVSEWMDNGNINEFINNHQGVDRAQLVGNHAASVFWRPTGLIHSAGGYRDWVGVHAQYSHGARRLEGGTILSVTGWSSIDRDDQANILVNQSFRACLADFGLSTIIGIERRAAANPSLTSMTSKTSLMSFTAGGTPRWMSPELLDPDRFGITDCRPTKQSDCYALGMVVYEVRVNATAPTSARI